MTGYETLRYEVDGQVARITIDRPSKLNALSWQTMRELQSALAVAKADATVRVVVLQGAGDRAFSAGADLANVGADSDVMQFHETGTLLTGVFTALWDLGKPTIARVHGMALGGGFGLALACDLVVAGKSATFGVPEVSVGVWPMLVTVPLVRSMPPKNALELMLTGRRVDAVEAAQIGFVTTVVADDALDDAVGNLASLLASRSPAVISIGRTAFYQVWDMPATDALPLLQALVTLLSQTRDFGEGMAAFREKRTPQWSGR